MFYQNAFTTPLKRYKMAAIHKCNLQIWHRTLQNILVELLEQPTK